MVGTKMSKDFEFKVKLDNLEPGIIGGQATNINFTHY